MHISGGGGSLGRQVCTEDGKNVYRNQKSVCRGIAGPKKKGFHCVKCECSLTELDLTCISHSSYDPGDVIFGDLDKLGWVVVRGFSKISQHSTNDIEAISEIHKISQTPGHYWHAINGMT